MRLSLLLVFLVTSLTVAQDFVLHNAAVYTVNTDQPTAEAFAVVDGKIAAIGTKEDVLAEHPDLPRMDAEGQTVIPGLIDAHGHLMGLAQTKLSADLVGATSKDEALERLKAFEAGLPDEAWLVGRGWDQNDWPEKTFPSRTDLDAQFPERPVYLTRVDGHAAWVNSAALRAGGIDASTPDPEGGAILKDQAGAPAGVLVDRAMDPVEAQIPEFTDAQLDGALQEAIAEAKSLGLTGMHDAGASLTDLARFQRAIDAGAFDLRVYAMIAGVGETLDYYCENGPLMAYGDKLTVRSVKLYMDGALGSRGAALHHDYSDDPGNRGLLMVEPDMMESAVTRSMNCGLQVNTHAIGDRGNTVVLDAYEASIDATGGGPGRHRVEHAQVVRLGDIARFADLDLIASMQPTHATSDMYWAEDRVGADRILGAYAWRKFDEAGVRLALGSDFPVERVNPMLGIYASVTRQDAEGWPEGGWYADQVLTREEALRGFTLDAAYAAFQEDTLGSLEVGKWADFLILSDDVMTVDAEAILTIEPVATYLAGEAVYTR